jgi:trimeric autotransporter adhesin
LQYGLIAEEVAKVYPDLVVRDPAGRIDGVRYDELAPLLLNEMQRQAAEIVELKQQTAEIAVLKQQMAQMAAAMLQSSGERMASR